MSDRFDDAYKVYSMLSERMQPAQALALMSSHTEAEIIAKIQERFDRELIEIKEMRDPVSVVLGNRYTWYTGPKPDDKCWPALTSLLRKQGWKDGAIDDLDASSTRVLAQLDHPHEAQFSTRGLVIGYVQSGKTTNFTALMAKAADRNYRLFIVLAGIHNGLRRQTQSRLMEQLVRLNPTLWLPITKLESDFVPTDNPASLFGQSNSTHLLCVVKKNAAVLRKLVRWLEHAKPFLGDIPTLIIDDEADQATVATKTINPLIRRLLATLPKAAYVGYTASPFANLLINPAADDLYPKHFITNLPQPKDHFGTEVLFGRYALDGEDPAEIDDGYDMIRTVPRGDIECVRPRTKAEAEDFVPIITDSLRDAIEYFWLATAARRVRKTGNPHSTMLIHTSVRASVHQAFREPLECYRDQLAGKLDDPATIDRLRTLWLDETIRVPAAEFNEGAVSFESVAAELKGVLNDCRIIMDNYASTDRLDYENGPVVAIAVGGNTLSRGLTLEGLIVSFFVRAVTVYDSLLQMGRWFGYRDGYADLPRIWMTAELEDWFRHLATVETEMRRDVDIYMVEDKTPMEFAVRLRTHPSLRVTAAAKMQDAVTAAAGYGGQRVQTRYFRTDSTWLLKNQDAATQLIEAAATARTTVEGSSVEGKFLFRNVPASYILEFLSNYQFHDKSQECNSKMMSRYIQARIRSAGALGHWNVAIVGNSAKSADQYYEFAAGISVGRVVRAAIVRERAEADIKTLMSRKDAAIDLHGEIGKLTELEIRQRRSAELPDTGLLVLYPIDKSSAPQHTGRPGAQERMPLNAEEHVIGVGLVFPKPVGSESTVPWEANYISADLSGIEPEDEDLTGLYEEQM